MSARTLAADGITRDFNGLRALDDVSLRLGQGDVVGLIGPNGSGKSTLVNIVSGTLRPDRGRVLVDGAQVTGRSPQAMAHLGVARTFQTVRLFGSMSVRENVQSGVLGAPAPPGGGTDARIDEVLAFAELRRWEHALATAIPYGTQRRVEVARALATSPAFLLLDEPAAGLNDEESDHLLALIRRIHDQGVGILVIDHDLRLILRLCQRVHVLVGGRTLVEGPPSQVRTHDGVVQAYIGTQRA